MYLKKIRTIALYALLCVACGAATAGTGAVVSLSRASADPSDSRPRVYADRAYQAISFDAQGDFGGDRPDDARWVRYPDSQMGAIASTSSRV